MNKISFELIESASEEINELNDSDVDALIERFTNEQPIVMTYLMAVFGDELTQEERELLFFVGIKIWYAISKAEPNMPLISEEDIENAEADNDDMLSYLAEESEEGFDMFAESLLENYHQNDLLTFALAGIVDEIEEDSSEAEDDESATGALFVAIKTIVDCFDKKM